MPSNYKRLGDYIQEVNIRNRDLSNIPLLGVSIKKVLMPSIANIIGTDMSTYKLIQKNQFAYGPVTSRNGDKISIALLQEYDVAMVSQAYTVFEVIDGRELLPEYLMMWFRRPEFDRYARFKTVVKSKAQEKQIDREFEALSGYSTYRVVKAAQEKQKGVISLGR